MISKATETNDNVNKLLDNLNTVSVSLDIARNEFSSLRNTQFIESRVYEEDETISTQDEVSEPVSSRLLCCIKVKLRFMLYLLKVWQFWGSNIRSLKYLVYLLQKEQKTETKEENVEDIKEAVLRGIELVDKYYEKVDVPGSDTEDETDFPK